MPQIFEPYVRLEDRKLPRTEGSGLGLAVVRRLVDRLGGDMAVESTPERGSTFHVWLPLVADARQ
jgi:signal transduction histidine kinase